LYTGLCLPAGRHCNRGHLYGIICVKQLAKYIPISIKK
jgi:hypothetical protein